VHKYVHSVTASNLIGFFVVFFGLIFVGALIGKLLSKLFRWTGLSWLDRLMGAAFGLVRGALAAVAFIAVLLSTFRPLRRRRHLGSDLVGQWMQIGTVKLTDSGQNSRPRLSLMRPVGGQSHSTFAWLRFSVRGDGRMEIVAGNVKEIGNWVMNGHETLEMSG